MRILISGSLGFIGTHLQPVLKERGHETLGFDIKRPSEVDVTDLPKMKMVVDKFFPNPDIIIHLAANTSSKIAQDYPGTDFMHNAVGTLNILELARSYKAKVIYPSTIKVKKNAIGSRSPYGLSKRVAEELCREWDSSFGVKSIVNRFSNLYGFPGGDHFWVNAMVKKALANEPIEVWGDGSATRDMLWVDDVVDLLVDEVEKFDGYYQAQLHSEQYPTLTIEAGGGAENLLSISQLLSELHYTNVTYKPELEGDKTILCTNNVYVSHINGWYPKVGLSEGIERLRHYYSNLPKPDANLPK